MQFLQESPAILNKGLSSLPEIPGAAQASLTDISSDIVIIAVVAAAVFVYAFYRGKKRMLASVNAFIATLALFLVFPYWEYVITPETSEQNTLMIQAAVFAGVFIFLRSMTRRMTYGSYPDNILPRALKAFALSLPSAGTAIAAAYHLFPLASIYQFSAPFNSLFTHPQALFWWLAGTLALMYLVVRH